MGKIISLFLILISSLLLTGCRLLPTPFEEPAKLSDITIIISNIITLLAPFAAIAFLIMLIWGGFQFLMSGGDPKAAAAARTTLTFAILGIILVVVVWLILLLIRYVTDVDVTEVSIPSPAP